MHSFFAQILCLASLLSQHSERQPPTNWDCKGGQYRETLGIHATSKNGVNGGYTFGEPYSVPINQLKLGLPSVNLTGTPLALHAELGTRASWESEADMKENAVIDRPLALAQQQPLICRGERVYWPWRTGVLAAIRDDISKAIPLVTDSKAISRCQQRPYRYCNAAKSRRGRWGQ